MKNHSILGLIILVIFTTSCSDSNNNYFQNRFETINFENRLPIRVNYDFDNLNLFLNIPINDSLSNIIWSWDPNGIYNENMPDTIGIDSYMNISQPIFYYNYHNTQPSLFATTYKQRIVEFGATLIFNFDEEKESLENLFDSLSVIDILHNVEVRQKLAESRIYISKNEFYEESITLSITDKKNDYDRIHYAIKSLP